MADFDFGAFLQSIGASGQEFAYDILSERRKHKKKVEERIYKETQRQEQQERDRKDTRKDFGIGVIEKVITGDFNPHTKQKFTQWGIEQGWIDPGILGLGVTPPPTTPGVAGVEGSPPITAGEMGPGGVAGMVEGLYSGGYTPPPTGEVPGILQPSAVAEEEGELFGRVEKEKTYKEKVRKWIEKNPNKPYPGLSMRQTHKVLGAYVTPEKGPTVAERKLRMDAVSVAALIRQGLRTEKTVYGEQRFPLIDKEDAINFAGEMGWTADTPEYQQHIAPATEEWWGRYQPEKIAELKADQFIRKSIRRHLKDLQKKGIIDRGQKIDDEAVDFYIEDNLEEVMKKWVKRENR